MKIQERAISLLQLTSSSYPEISTLQSSDTSSDLDPCSPPADRADLQLQHPAQHPDKAIPPSSEITEFLDYPEQYLSTRADVERLRSRLLSEIKDAVRGLMQATKTDSRDEPRLHNWLRSPLFFQLWSKVYGTTTKEELFDQLSTRDCHSSLSLGRTLEVMLAAAVTVWVFEKQHEESPRESFERKMTSIESDLATSKASVPISPEVQNLTREYL